MGLSPRSAGLAVAGVTLAADQGSKLWLLHVVDIANRQPIEVTPFFNVLMAWNPGISYSLFAAETAQGRLTLLLLTLAATALLAAWLWRAPDRLTGWALGLLVGGALGNAYDRWAYGAVADFFHFHVGAFSWYVFNIADVAIVAGVGLLLYESLLKREDAKDRPAPPSGP